MRTRFALWIILLGCFLQPAAAQWKIVAPSVASGRSWRAMTYRDGLLWLAGDELSMSSDLGLTWKSYTWPCSNLPFDIDFFDRSHGVACGTAVTVVTSDAGSTWTELVHDGSTSVCFGRTVNEIGACLRSSEACITTDGGSTWQHSPVGSGFPFCIRRLRDGSISAFQGSTNGGFFHNTKDGGRSWTKSAGHVDWDSYSFAQDSCEAGTFYVSNEDLIAPTDSYSSIFITTNAGGTWRRTQDRPLATLTGSVAASAHAVYCPTTYSGILRSLDHGLTWTNIGGPPVSADTRLIVAVSDNILLAVDDDGNVWRTMNSGGDSVIAVKSTLSLSKQSVDFDTLSLCEFATSAVHITRNCGSPSVIGALQESADSTTFSVLATQDSLAIFFSPSRAGRFDSKVYLLLSTGDTLGPITVTGVGRSLGWSSLRTDSVFTDTVGGDVYLPIIVHDRLSAGQLTVRASYDTTSLEYIDAFAKQTAEIDATGAQSRGSALIVFRGLSLSSDSIVGYIHFRVFPIRTECTSVTLDSIRFVEGKTQCVQSLPTFAAQICWGSDCNSPLLSALLRYHLVPRLTVTPNPATSTVQMRSTIDLQMAMCTICNAAGRKVRNTQLSLRRDTPVALEIRDLAPGVYYVTVTAPNAGLRERFVVQR